MAEAYFKAKKRGGGKKKRSSSGRNSGQGYTKGKSRKKGGSY